MRYLFLALVVVSMVVTFIEPVLAVTVDVFAVAIPEALS